MAEPEQQTSREARSRYGRRLVLTLVAALLAVAAVVAVLVVQQDRKSDPHPGPAAPAAGTAPTATPTATSTTPAAADLLDADQVRQLGPTHRWVLARTDDHTGGTGIRSVCQQDRFADPDGLDAVVRVSRAADDRGRRTVQTVEISRSPRQALAAYRTTLRWYAGCEVARLQLLDAYRVDDLGDQADLLVFRLWREPVSTVSVAVARTGSVTTSLVSTTVGRRPPGAARMARALEGAVSKLCARTTTPGCIGLPRLRAVPPPPSGGERGALATVDLPPVGRIDEPWVGTRTVRARRAGVATSCDRAGFVRAGAPGSRTGTYLIPQANLPPRFGLSETFGRFRTGRAAQRFMADVRRSVAGCEKRDLASQVGAERRDTSRRQDASSWNVTTEVSETDRVRFRLGFVRVGRRVAQLSFTPTAADDMSQAAFDDLLGRAGDRLRELRP
jgi:hypothetical protein